MPDPLDIERAALRDLYRIRLGQARGRAYMSMVREHPDWTPQELDQALALEGRIEHQSTGLAALAGSQVLAEAIPGWDTLPPDQVPDALSPVTVDAVVRITRPGAANIYRTIRVRAQWGWSMQQVRDEIDLVRLDWQKRYPGSTVASTPSYWTMF